MHAWSCVFVVSRVWLLFHQAKTWDKAHLVVVKADILLSRSIRDKSPDFAEGMRDACVIGLLLTLPALSLLI